MSPFKAEVSPAGHRIGSQRFKAESMSCCLCLDGGHCMARDAHSPLEPR